MSLRNKSLPSQNTISVDWFTCMVHSYYNNQLYGHVIRYSFKLTNVIGSSIYGHDPCHESSFLLSHTHKSRTYTLVHSRFDL